MSGQTAAQENRTAGVSPQAPWRIRAVSVLPDYRLAVTCMDGRKGVVNLSAVSTSLQAGIYAALADPAVFAQVYLDLGVLTWPNGADLDPAWVHESLTEQAEWNVPL